MRKALGLMMVVICIVAVHAQATTYFEETFEGLSVGTDITNGMSATTGSWIVSSIAGDSTTYAKVAADPAGGSGKCVHLYDISTSAKPKLSAYFSDVTEASKIEYDMYVPEWTQGNSLMARSGGNNGYLTYLYTRMEANATTGEAKNYGGDDTVLTNSLPVDTWVHVEMDLPEMPQSGTFTFHMILTTAGGTLFDGDVTSYYNTASNDVVQCAFSQPSGTNLSNVYLDNVQVTPEPATLSLLCGGGLMCLLRRIK